MAKDIPVSTASLLKDFDLTVSEEELKRYLNFPDAVRIVPAEALLDSAKNRIAFGVGNVAGVCLPWEELKNDVRITPGTLAVWSGLTHHGKSQMLKQVMLAAIQQGEKVCIASFEEEIENQFFDMGCMAVASQDPRLLQMEEFADFARGRLWFYDHQGKCDSQRMEQVIRYCAAERGVTQFVIDSLMLISVGKNYDKFAGYVDFVSDLKIIASDTKCTIHLVAHNKKPQLKAGETAAGSIYDISGAHEIGSMADYVLSVWRNKTPLSERAPTERDAKLTVEKQRGRLNWIGSFSLNFHTGSRQFIRGIEAMTFWDKPTHAEF
jgi:twinkle protein